MANPFSKGWKYLMQSFDTKIDQNADPKVQIQQAVASGEIMSLAQVLSAAGIGSNAEVLNVQVCDEGGRFVYIIGVLTPDGEAQNLVLSAN